MRHRIFERREITFDRSVCGSFQVAEARREAEEKRDAKYAKMERQREDVRQGIREKVSAFLEKS